MCNAAQCNLCTESELQTRTHKSVHTKKKESEKRSTNHSVSGLSVCLTHKIVILSILLVDGRIFSI